MVVRRALTLVVGLLTAVAVCGLSGLPAATDAQNAGTIVPGSALAGIPLGGPISNLMARLGPVTQVRVAAQDGTLAYVFDQYGITAYVARDVIVAITTTNSLLAGVRGIYLGAPMLTVVKTFGGDYTPGIIEGFHGLLYPSLGLGFGFDQGGVAIVMVFSSLAAPQRDPASPAPSVTTGNAPAPPVSSPVTAGKAPAVPIGAAPAGESDASDARLGLRGASAGVTTIPGVGGTSGLPDVRHLRAFTAETNYLSRAGYLRYVVYSMTRAWISPVESERFILQGESLPSP